MNLSERQNKLWEFVVESHGDQSRKYTGEPYHEHLLSVYNIANEWVPSVPLLFECCVCHDLVEDTDVDFFELSDTLLEVGYTADEAEAIVFVTEDLTDEYTKEEYPKFNRLQRKSLERLRLSRISSHAQTIKYADIIDNLRSIVEYDEEFAKVYLKEVYDLLSVMNTGDFDLYAQALYQVYDELRKLKMLA